MVIDRLVQLYSELAATGDVTCDAPAFFLACGRGDLAEHSARVAANAVRLAAMAGVDPRQAEVAAWLHDIGVVVPLIDRFEAVRRFGFDLLAEEMRQPHLLHQKVSAGLGRQLFGITDSLILSAIGCHTTLRRDATRLDKVLFVADKLSWDPADLAPGFAEAGRCGSLDEAIAILLAELRAENPSVVHPWLKAAYEQVTGTAWDGGDVP